MRLRGGASSSDADNPLPSVRIDPADVVMGPVRPGGFRGFVFDVVHWPPFDFFILFVIISSCAVMATQSPIKKLNDLYTPREEEVYSMLEDTFLWIFTAEVTLKLIALGYHRASPNAINNANAIVHTAPFSHELITAL